MKYFLYFVLLCFILVEAQYLSRNLQVKLSREIQINQATHNNEKGDEHEIYDANKDKSVSLENNILQNSVSQGLIVSREDGQKKSTTVVVSEIDKINGNSSELVQNNNTLSQSFKQCLDNINCSAGQKCYKGYCIKKLNDCSNKHCSSGQMCLAGTCITLRGLDKGAYCSMTSQCMLGLACVNKVCTPSTIGTAGTSCIMESDCQCTFNCINQICTTFTVGNGNQNSLCLHSSQCIGNRFCILNRCTSLVIGDGSLYSDCLVQNDCSRGLQCLANICIKKKNFLDQKIAYDQNNSGIHCNSDRECSAQYSICNSQGLCESITCISDAQCNSQMKCQNGRCSHFENQVN